MMYISEVTILGVCIICISSVSQEQLSKASIKQIKTKIKYPISSTTGQNRNNSEPVNICIKDVFVIA